MNTIARAEAQIAGPVAYVDSNMPNYIFWENGTCELENGTKLFTHSASADPVVKPSLSVEREALISWQNVRAQEYASRGFYVYSSMFNRTANMLAADAQDEWHRGRAAGIEECEKLNAELKKLGAE